MHRWVRGLAAIVVAGMTAGVLAGCEAAGSAVVSRVIDGDTIDVIRDGQALRVQLLDVDAAEALDPDDDVRCLGLEAAMFLAELLPHGTDVELLPGGEPGDPYGVAAVYLPDGRLANAELVRAGLAVPVVGGEDDRFTVALRTARQEAVAAERGFYDPAIACTPPGQVRAAEAALVTTSAAPVTPQGAEQAVTSAAAVLATATTLQAKFTPSPRSVAWVAAAMLPDLRGRTAAVVHSAQRHRDAMTAAAAALRDRPDPEPPASRRSAPDTSAAGSANARRSDAGGSTGSSSASGSGSAGRSGGGGTSTPGKRNQYSAPQRCYAPGGKTWRPC